MRFARIRAETIASLRAAPDAGEVADDVERDLRVVRAGLDAQVAVAAGGIQRVSRQCRKVGECGRALSGQAESVVEEGRPESDRHGEPRRAEVEGLAGVDRWL